MCLESSDYSVWNSWNRDKDVLSVCDISPLLRADLNRYDVLTCILSRADNCNLIDVP